MKRFEKVKTSITAIVYAMLIVSASINYYLVKNIVVIGSGYNVEQRNAMQALVDSVSK